MKQQQQQKSKRYYSRVSKKKYKTQKGGAAAAAPIAPTINATELQQELMPFRTDTETFFSRAVELLRSLKHFKLIELITKVFTKSDGTHPMFHIDKSMSGPLIDMQNNLGFMTTEPPTPETSYLEWYKKYNPNFLPIGQLSPDKLQFTVKIKGVEIPIFETLIAQVCRDACFMILTGKKNMDNRYRNQISIHTKNQNIFNNFTSKHDQLKVLLNKCNLCYTTNNYLNVIDMLSDYIDIVSTSGFAGDHRKFAKETLEKSKHLPYILYPTYTQISYKSIVLLSTAPIINFRLTNRRRTIHNIMSNTATEIFHDVIAHGKYTHGYGVLKDKQNYIERFNLFYIFIKFLLPKFADQGSNDGKIYAFILFAFIHETHKALNILLSDIILDENAKKDISEGLLKNAKENKFFEFMKLEKDKINESYFLPYLEEIITTIKDNIETLNPLLKYLVSFNRF